MIQNCVALCLYFFELKHHLQNGWEKMFQVTRHKPKKMPPYLYLAPTAISKFTLSQHTYTRNVFTRKPLWPAGLSCVWQIMCSINTLLMCAALHFVLFEFLLWSL